MAEAVELIARLMPRLAPDPEAIAVRLLEAVIHAEHGEFDGIIPATAEALGSRGLEHLKAITNAWADQPPTAQERAAHRSLGRSRSPAESVRRSKDLTRSLILAGIADAQGDVDACMARSRAEQLTRGTVALWVARRLLDAGRVAGAFDVVTRARAAEAAQSFRILRPDLDAVHEECLARLAGTTSRKPSCGAGSRSASALTVCAST